jgi:hypothetical protein
MYFYQLMEELNPALLYPARMHIYHVSCTSHYSYRRGKVRTWADLALTLLKMTRKQG